MAGKARRERVKGCYEKVVVVTKRLLRKGCYEKVVVVTKRLYSNENVVTKRLLRKGCCCYEKVVTNTQATHRSRGLLVLLCYMSHAHVHAHVHVACAEGEERKFVTRAGSGLGSLFIELYSRCTTVL